MTFEKRIYLGRQAVKAGFPGAPGCVWVHCVRSTVHDAGQVIKQWVQPRRLATQPPGWPDAWVPDVCDPGTRGHMRDWLEKKLGRETAEVRSDDGWLIMKERTPGANCWDPIMIFGSYYREQALVDSMCVENGCAPCEEANDDSVAPRCPVPMRKKLLRWIVDDNGFTPTGVETAEKIAPDVLRLVKLLESKDLDPRQVADFLVRLIRSAANRIELPKKRERKKIIPLG